MKEFYRKKKHLKKKENISRQHFFFTIHSFTRIPKCQFNNLNARTLDRIVYYSLKNGITSAIKISLCVVVVVVFISFLHHNIAVVKFIKLTL